MTERRRGAGASRRRRVSPIALILAAVQAALFVGLGTFLHQGDGVAMTDLALGGAALAGTLLIAGTARARRAAKPLPAIDLDQLSARIGTRIVAIEAASAEADPAPQPVLTSAVLAAAAPVTAVTPPPAVDLYDLQLFAAVGVPKFVTSRERGAPCAIVVLSVDSFFRRDGPRRDRPPLPLDAIAQAIRSNVRTYDVAARYGDDEFILFLDRCERDEAQRIVQRLSESITEITFAFGMLGLSAGIAVFPEAGTELYGLIQQADAMLREIRHTGRSEIRVVAGASARPFVAHGVVA